MAKLDQIELEGILNSLIGDAEDFIDSELSPVRALATQYYQGEVPDLEADQGRSKMTTHDLRDTVKAMLPSIMRVFTSSEKVVEFAPTGPEDEALCDQVTEYANHVLMKDNDGFLILHSTFKDALVRKCGLVKAWWDESERTITQKYTGLDEQTMQLIMMEPNTDVEVTGTTYEQIDPSQPPIPYFSATVTKQMSEGRIKVCALPPEELLVGRNDRWLGETYVGHRRMMTISDLVKMGYDQDQVERKAGEDKFNDNDELLIRSPLRWFEGGDSLDNPAMRRVLYIESYAFIDRNGDGIAEHLKICTIGSDYEIVAIEEVDFHPFVAFPCDPEPHLTPVEGYSVADDVMDIQRLKSAVWRNSLDGLAQSLNPRTGVVEGQVNIDDVLNNEVGALIRMKNPAAVVPFLTPDVSANGLQMLAYADEVKEARTGMSKAAMGLDPDALRSTARNAANAVVTATQSQLEMVTRMLANGVRDLFKLILKLMVTHQEQPRMVRLRGGWVQVDPRTWNSNMDVSINVALGTGTNEEKFNILAGITQKQEMILQTMGPSNPLVSLAQYSATLIKMFELAGFKNAGQFVSALPPDFQMPPAPPPVDPNAEATRMLAEVEMQKAQMKMQVDQAKMQADQQVQAAKLELEREKMQADFARKQLELEMQAAKMQAELQMKEAEMVLKQLTMIRGGQENEANANEASEGQEASEARQEGMLSQAIMALGTLIAQSQQATAQALNTPKRVIRDQNGRVAGVAPMDMEEPGEREDD